MFLVEVMPLAYFHYFLNGKMILGSKKFAKKLTIDEINNLQLNCFKLECIEE